MSIPEDNLAAVQVPAINNLLTTSRPIALKLETNNQTAKNNFFPFNLGVADASYYLDFANSQTGDYDFSILTININFGGILVSELKSVYTSP